MKIKDFDPKYKRRSNDIVCSLHFAKSSMQPVSRQLVDHALPIYFPQKAATLQRTKLPTEQPVSGQPKSTKLPVPDSTSVDSKCCIGGCPTKFDKTEPKIRGFKYVFVKILLHDEFFINCIRNKNTQISYTIYSLIVVYNLSQNKIILLTDSPKMMNSAANGFISLSCITVKRALNGTNR